MPDNRQHARVCFLVSLGAAILSTAITYAPGAEVLAIFMTGVPLVGAIGFAVLAFRMRRLPPDNPQLTSAPLRWGMLCFVAIVTLIAVG